MVLYWHERVGVNGVGFFGLFTYLVCVDRCMQVLVGNSGACVLFLWW